MDIKTLLQKLGLTPHEGQIYLSLLNSHRASIADISRDTGIYRPTVYRVLPSLINKGLISETHVGKRTMYIPESPEVLQRLVSTISEDLTAAIPELTGLYEGSQKRPIIRYFEGRTAILHIYENMIQRMKKGDAVHRYESPRNYKMLARYYPNLYWKKATGPESQIEKFVITNETTKKLKRERLLRHVKAIPQSFDQFDYNITQLIYKDTVAFIDFDTETATVIQNKRFADFQLKIFKMLFGKL